MIICLVLSGADVVISCDIFYINFITLPMNALGIFGRSSTSLSLMVNELCFDNTHQQQIIMKASCIAIGCT